MKMKTTRDIHGSDLTKFVIQLNQNSTGGKNCYWYNLIIQ